MKCATLCKRIITEHFKRKIEKFFEYFSCFWALAEKFRYKDALSDIPLAILCFDQDMVIKKLLSRYSKTSEMFVVRITLVISQ